MQEGKNQASELVEHAEAFTSSLLKMVFVNLTQKGVVLAAGLINNIFIFIAIAFAVLFAGAGLAWWLGDLIGSHAAGFFIVAGIFILLTGLILFLKRKKVIPLIRNMIVKKIYE